MLPRSFYAQPTLMVARQLLGMRLARLVETPNGVLSIHGIITETEAYTGKDDLACHARAGRTPRTQVMFGPPGHAYVYFTYGMHWCLNFVTEEDGVAGAALIRAIEPLDSQEWIAARRPGRPPAEWCNGPAKLCQALAIDGALNAHDLCSAQSRLYVESAPPIPDSRVTIGPRVGLNNTPEPWKSIPWRFRVSPPDPSNG